jgi:hypothetical protein
MLNKIAIPFSLSVVLGMSALGWLTFNLVIPKTVNAYTSRLDVTLNRLPDESFQSLLRRAETVARAATQRSFDRDLLISEVQVMVLGEHQGIITPVLLLQVTRPNWKNSPDPQQWSIYFSHSESFLGFDQPSPDAKK